MAVEHHSIRDRATHCRAFDGESAILGSDGFERLTQFGRLFCIQSAVEAGDESLADMLEPRLRLDRAGLETTHLERCFVGSQPK